MPSGTKRPAPPRPRAATGAGLGPLLCWAVVFADIGTSVYYTPGILFGQVGAHAALFVGLTLIVFLLLTIKYAEVAIRYPEGGGVVTVGAHAANPVVGLVGGLFILVDYFLTSALSALSGLIYLSALAPNLRGAVVGLTVVALILLAGLNLVGISADAKITVVIAVVALTSQLAVVLAVVLHVGIHDAVAAVPKVFSGPRINGLGLLTGYAGAFLAFSGLESISQLAPAMAKPKRRVAPRAMALVVVTVVITSPLLTLWSTTLLDARHNDPNQFVSVLGGYAGGPLLQTVVAGSAALLLVFASNTAIIGCYHIFLALSRIGFLPRLIQRCNRWRGTPHWAILAATAVPVAVVLISLGDVAVLGDMYAFGLLGAFTVTCICLDIVRWRERRHRRGYRRDPADQRVGTSTPMFIVGVLTSVLVAGAWVTNLFAKPLATLFGGGVTLVGLGVAGLTYRLRRRRGYPGVIPLVHHLDQLVGMHRGAWKARAPVVVLLHGDAGELAALVHAGVNAAGELPLVFAYVGGVPAENPATRLLEIFDPYHIDYDAHAAFRTVRTLASGRRGRRHMVYVPQRDRAAAAAELWGTLHPHEFLLLQSDEGVLKKVGGYGRRRHVVGEGIALTIFSGVARAGEAKPGPRAVKRKPSR